ncbi:MAG: hypothetical protein LBM95_08330 [Lactobacillales bacterium]|nr:hypothetical protein [Lactobacillales bacterium]
MKIIQNRIIKNKLIFSRFFIPIFFSVTLFFLMLRAYFFFYLFRMIQENQNDKIPLLEKLLNPNTGDDLVLLLTILEVGSLIILITSIIYVFFFTIISLKRERILESKELNIKSILGVSPAILTLEFIGEHVVAIVGAYILGMGVVNVIYSIIYYAFLTDWVSQYLINPLSFFFYYDLICLGLSLLLLLVLILNMYLKLRNQYYNYVVRKSKGDNE